MKHRKALRLATDSAVWLFLVMTIGVVLWTTDEMLDWNILPDWIDAFAQLLVIIMSILTGFAVIISIMCSFAVIAESSMERAGNPNLSHKPSRRVRVLATSYVLLALTVGVTLHKYEDLIDLPSVWEHDTVAALFEGQQLTVPSGRSGAFIDTRKPSAWGLIQVDESVVGIIMLRLP